jgi:hypothetical protein
MSSYKIRYLIFRRFAVIYAIVLCLLTMTVAQYARTQGPSSSDGNHQLNFAAQGQGRNTTNRIDETRLNDSETRIRYSDGDHSVEIKAKESLEFTDDDADVKSISRDGYLMIEERRGSTSRRLEVLPGADGKPQRSFYVQGQPRALDQEAHAWLAEVLPGVIRNTAIGARARVQRIYRQHGAGGVLDEISLIKSDGAKRIYFSELLHVGNLDQSALRRAARQVGHEMHSDGEKAILLIESADSYLGNEAVAPAFFEAVNSINSDGEHRRVLSAILKKSLSTENILRSLKSAMAINSDGEKANLLIQNSDLFLDKPSSIPALFDTINSINSDGEHARVLSALLKRHEPGKENLLRILRSVERMSSDGEKANVLIRAAKIYASDDGALSAIAGAAKTLNSDGEKQRVMSALLRQGQHP